METSKETFYALARSESAIVDSIITVFPFSRYGSIDWQAVMT
jgi:hypothetical protein